MLSLTNSEESLHIAWVKWTLPSQHTEQIWRGITPDDLLAAPMEQVTVQSHTGSRETCCQNKHGMLNNISYGLAYPATAHCTSNNQSKYKGLFKVT